MICFASVSLITFLIISIRFLIPKDLRLSKFKFLMIPIAIMSLLVVFFPMVMIYLYSVMGSYIISLGIKNWIKSKMIKSNI